MRTTLTALLTVVILMLGVTTVAPPAAATAAEPYQLSDCMDVGGGVESCVEIHGVLQANETPSGDTQYQLSGKLCFTTTAPTGEVVEEGCLKSNFMLHQQDGEVQVYHTNQKNDFAFEYQGTNYECTFSSNITYANGELRHDDLQAECNPSL